MANRGARKDNGSHGGGKVTPHEEMQQDMLETQTATAVAHEQKELDAADEPAVTRTAPQKGGLDTLHTLVHNLRSRREQLDSERSEIDRDLEGIKGEIDDLLGRRQTPRTNGNGHGRAAILTPKRNARRMVSKPRGRGRPRKGENQGTDILIDILRRHKGRMLSSELARMGEEQGMKSAHSSIQSLKNRKKAPKIKLTSGFAELVEDDG